MIFNINTEHKKKSNKVYLFSPNDAHTEITGGWERTGWVGSVTVSDTLNFSSGSGSLRSNAATVNAIDMTPYNTLFIVVSSVSNCNAYLYSQRGTKFNLHTGENTFDISKVTGADYLYIASIDSDGGSCKISEIWLE